jgi:hypothetical protein
LPYAIGYKAFSLFFAHVIDECVSFHRELLFAVDLGALFHRALPYAIEYKAFSLFSVHAFFAVCRAESP